jgi:hypothetical protein
MWTFYISTTAKASQISLPYWLGMDKSGGAPPHSKTQARNTVGIAAHVLECGTAAPLSENAQQASD